MNRPRRIHGVIRPYMRVVPLRVRPTVGMLMMWSAWRFLRRLTRSIRFGVGLSVQSIIAGHVGMWETYRDAVDSYRRTGLW